MREFESTADIDIALGTEERSPRFKKALATFDLFVKAVAGENSSPLNQNSHHQLQLKSKFKFEVTPIRP